MPAPGPDRQHDDSQVVPLREFLEQQILASHTELAADIKLLRAEQASGQLQSSREHSAVQEKIGDLKGEIARLATSVAVVKQADASQATTVGVLWKLAAAFGGLIATAASVTAIIVALSH